MLRFGYFYLNGQFMLYDIAFESRQGQWVYIASLSADPRLCVVASSAELAVERLKRQLKAAPPSAPRSSVA